MGTEIVTIFIACDAHLLEERLIGRGDSITEIQRRLKISVEESKSILGEYDFVVINNGTISDTVNKLECIIKSQIFEDNISFNDVSFREEIQEILQKYDM